MQSKPSLIQIKFLRLVETTPRLRCLFTKNPESEELFSHEFQHKTQEEEVFFFLIHLGELAFKSQDHFVSAVLLLKALLLNYSPEVCRLCWDSLLKMGMYQTCRNLVHFFPEVFPRAKEILDVITRLEKAGEIFQNRLCRGQIKEAGNLARDLVQNVGDANTYRMMWEFAEKTGDEKSARENLEKSFFFNPHQERVAAACRDVFLNDEKRRMLFETNVPFFSDFTDFLAIIEAWKKRDLTLFRNTFRRLVFSLKHQATHSYENQFPEISALICREIILDLLLKGTNPLDVVVDLIKISEPLFSELNGNLRPHPKFLELSQEIKEFFPKKKDGEKFLLANLEVLALILSLTNQKEIKKRYLSRLIDIECYGLMEAIPKNMNLVSLCRETFTTVYSDLPESIGYFNKAMIDIPLNDENEFALKKGYFWMFIMWLVYGHQTAFLELYELMKNQFYEGIKRHLTEFVFFMHFPLSHIFLNLTQTQEEWKKFNEEIEKPLSDYIKNVVVPSNRVQPVLRTVSADKQSIKVGFVYDRLVKNSPFKVFYSLLKPLVKDNTARELKIYVYDIEYMEKSLSDPNLVKMIGELGLPYVSNHELISDAKLGFYYSRLKKCLALRKRIITDGIEVLVMCNSHEQYNFLFTTRTAPVQIFWSHGNYSYDIPEIDERMMHVTIELDTFEGGGHSFVPIRIGNDQSFYTPHVPPEKINDIRDKFPRDSFILGCIGRLIKMESLEYLEVLTEILKNNVNCIFLACGVGGTDKIKNWLNQLGVLDRFFFPGMIDPHPYGHIIDLYLNSFPYPSGESRSEYLAKGKSSVSLVKVPFTSYFDGNPESQEILRESMEYANVSFDDLSFVDAFSTGEYIEKANCLISDLPLRQRISLFHKRLWELMIGSAQSRTFNSFSKFIRSAVLKKTAS